MLQEVLEKAGDRVPPSSDIKFIQSQLPHKKLKEAKARALFTKDALMGLALAFACRDSPGACAKWFVFAFNSAHQKNYIPFSDIPRLFDVAVFFQSKERLNAFLNALHPKIITELFLLKDKCPSELLFALAACDSGASYTLGNADIEACIHAHSAVYLICSHTITTLDLSCQISHDVISNDRELLLFLAMILQKKTALERLSLANQHIDDEALKLLIQALDSTTNRQRISLDLRGCQLSAAGKFALLAFLKRTQRIKEIQMETGEVSDEMQVRLLERERYLSELENPKLILLKEQALFLTHNKSTLVNIMDIILKQLDTSLPLFMRSEKYLTAALARNNFHCNKEGNVQHFSQFLKCIISHQWKKSQGLTKSFRLLMTCIHALPEKEQYLRIMKNNLCIMEKTDNVEGLKAVLEEVMMALEAFNDTFISTHYS